MKSKIILCSERTLWVDWLKWKNWQRWSNGIEANLKNIIEIVVIGREEIKANDIIKFFEKAWIILKSDNPKMIC